MPRGGYRPGAGKKLGVKHKKTLEQEEARELIRGKVFKELEPIISAQIALAKGHWYEEITLTGTKRVYQKSPDKGAAEMLLNQTIGKPKESMELTGGFKLLIDC